MLFRTRNRLGKISGYTDFERLVRVQSLNFWKARKKCINRFNIICASQQEN